MSGGFQYLDNNRVVESDLFRLVLVSIDALPQFVPSIHEVHKLGALELLHHLVLLELLLLLDPLDQRLQAIQDLDPVLDQARLSWVVQYQSIMLFNERH